MARHPSKPERSDDGGMHTQHWQRMTRSVVAIQLDHHIPRLRNGDGKQGRSLARGGGLRLLGARVDAAVLPERGRSISIGQSDDF